MGKAKDIILKPLKSKEANDFIKRQHYSGKVVQNSQFHIGVYLGGKLGGAMSFGPSLDKSKLVGLVEGTKWNEFIELNRMAFSDLLPRNSESRAIAVAMRILKQYAPHIKWVLSFADATQCGDGTIYRASGFVLTGINESKNIAKIDDFVIHKMTLESNPKQPRPELGGRSYYDITGGRYDFKKYVKKIGAKIIPGHQLRYIYFLDKSCQGKLTVPIIPFSEIEKRGAKMYKGVRSDTGDTGDTPGDQLGEGGLTPTRTLHNKVNAV